MKTATNARFSTASGAALARSAADLKARPRPIQTERAGMTHSAAGATAVSPPYKAEVRSLNFFYGEFQALKNINLQFADCRVTALIGPSGCGKSTLLRCFNRIHDLYPGTRYEGEIMLHPSGANIVSRSVDPISQVGERTIPLGGQRARDAIAGRSPL